MRTTRGVIRHSEPSPEGLANACARFAQGHLLRGVAPVLVTSDRPAAQWQSSAPEDAARVLTLRGKDLPPFTIILDQGCDIEKLSAPFVHLAPVYNLTRYYKANKVEQARSAIYRYELTASKLEEQLTEEELEGQRPKGDQGYLWVADLRLEFPIDKGLLIDRSPIDGFAEAHEALDFGRYLAARRDRPAIPRLIEDVVVRGDAGVTAVTMADGTLLSGVVELRVSFDHVVVPTSAALLVMTEEENPPADLVRAWTDVVANLSAFASEYGLRVSLTHIGGYRGLSAESYRNSSRLPLAV
jgi:hypothetical protein